MQDDLHLAIREIDLFSEQHPDKKNYKNRQILFSSPGWSVCSKKCGVGEQTRDKWVIKEETQTCNTQACPGKLVSEPNNEVCCAGQKV